MKKDAYYFSHDANAQDDPKCILLIDQMGMEGYGIFWCLIEKLRAETDYRLPLKLAHAFAMRWHTSAEKIITVIKSYDLFQIEDEYFFSQRLRNSMNEKTEKARLSASYRWNNATALQPHATGMRSNAIKGKERKEKKANTFSPDGDKSEYIPGTSIKWRILPNGRKKGPFKDPMEADDGMVY